MNKYKVLIEGYDLNYYLKKIIRNKINIYDIKKDKNKLYLIISVDDYDKLLKLSSSYKITIIERYGFSKIKYLIKKYFIFLISFVLGIIINIIISNMILQIEVIHTNKNIRELVYSELKRYGISKYKFKINYQKRKKIVNNILEDNKDNLEWMEIEEVGTKYIIKVEERIKNKITDSCKLENIVASKKAMILEIKASSGEVVKKINDYVNEGDIIISGVIHNKDDVVSKRCARGIVYGEVWYLVKVELPREYSEEKLTGKNKKHFELTFLNNNYSLNNYKNYKRSVNKIISSNLLPISFNYTNYLETSIINKNYDLNNSVAVAFSKADDKLVDKIGKDSSIREKKILKKYIKNSKIIIEIFYKVKENITKIEEYKESDSNDKTN